MADNTQDLFEEVMDKASISTEKWLKARPANVHTEFTPHVLLRRTDDGYMEICTRLGEFGDPVPWFPAQGDVGIQELHMVWFLQGMSRGMDLRDEGANLFDFWAD